MGAGYNGEMSVQSMGDMGNETFSNLFLENIDRRGSNDESRELIPVFHKPHRK